MNSLDNINLKINKFEHANNITVKTLIKHFKKICVLHQIIINKL